MVELKAKPRTITGKQVKTLRQEGFLPAVLYGENIPSQPITVPYRDFESVYREAGESSLVKLEVDGKPYTVLIYDITHDPLRGTPLHADFYAVRMDKVIQTKVPLVFNGESPAVKNEGGILIKVRQEVEVEALPQDLPHEIRVDISALEAIGSRISVADIPVLKGVKILAEEEDVVVLIEAPRSEEELAEILQPAEGGAPAEVKTEREVKAETKAKEGGVEEEAGKTEEQRVK